MSARPNFSGEWQLDRAASALSSGADAVQSGNASIEHDEPMFRYRAEFLGPGDPVKVQYEMRSNGSEAVATHEGVTITSSLRWEGDVLVANWQIQRPDGEITISFRHELIDDGEGLRATERLRDRAREQDNVWIFRKV